MRARSTCPVSTIVYKIMISAITRSQISRAPQVAKVQLSKLRKLWSRCGQQGHNRSLQEHEHLTSIYSNTEEVQILLNFWRCLTANFAFNGLRSYLKHELRAHTSHAGTYCRASLSCREVQHTVQYGIKTVAPTCNPKGTLRPSG